MHSFCISHRLILINTDDQSIDVCLRELEKVDMPYMQDIKASRNQPCRQVGCAMARYDGCDSVNGFDFVAAHPDAPGTVRLLHLILEVIAS